jgi:hypothetical protein
MYELLLNQYDLLNNDDNSRDKLLYYHSKLLKLIADIL